MSRPITWQTVRGAEPIEALRGIQVAQQMGSGAFDQFGKILQTAQATDEANWNKTRDNNTQAFLEKLYSAGNSEQLKAMQDSGELQRMVQANGAQIDRVAARNALDGRMTTLQARDKQAWEFANAELDQREAPTIDAIKGHLARGNLEGAKPLIASLSARGQANTLALADTRERELLMRTRGDMEFGWKANEEVFKQQLRPEQIKQTQAQTRAANAQANASNASAALTNYTIDKNKGEDAKAVERAKLAAALKGNLYEEGEYTDQDAPEILKLMSDGKVGGTGGDAPLKQAKVMARLNELARNGVEIKTKDATGKETKVRVPIPMGVLKSTLLGTENTLLSWNEGWADDFEQKLKSRLQTIETGNGSADNRAVRDYQNLLSIRRLNAEATPGAKLTRK